ncbi:MAG: type II toxin-antitoxin system RatA family toxin [Gammaproteobacteria bacterium]|nr:type II toxin-antitoxin system RatA family toxin [Gammaproteobacteria bacterium]
MPTINKSALVPYNTHEMYEVVDDVEHYAQFLPWCGSSSVLSRNEDEVKACIEIAHRGIHKSFTTRNRLQKNKIIEMSLVDGPFKRLHGFWIFKSLGDDGCKVSLDLEYEFSNKILSIAIGPVFGQIANSMVDAFCKRADELYAGE